MIQLENISKRFNKLTVLRDVNIELRENEILSLLGPSGCGKSTLLRIIADLETPDTGNRILSKKNINLSYVFQDAELLSWRNLEENVRLPIELKEKSSGLRSENEIAQKVDEVLSLVKLEKFKKYYPHQLSGGMKMRASIARAFVTNPELILMDEPFSALDESTRFELQEQLVQLQKLKKISLVFVTHSIGEAVFLSHRIQVLSIGNKSQRYELQIQEENRSEFRNSMVYNNYVTEISTQMKAALDLLKQTLGGESSC